MTTVGRAAVLDDNFLTKATADKTSPADIADANRFVYAVLKSAVSGTPAAKVVEKVGRFNGSLAWFKVRRFYELTGHSVRDQLRKEIDAFAPVGSETPDEAFDRLDDLLQDYIGFPSATPFTEDDLIKMHLRVAQRYAALDIKVRMIQASLSAGDRPPHKSTCEYIVNELLGEWLSFGAYEEMISIHLGTMTPTDATSAHILALQANLDAAHAQVKIAQAAAGAHLGGGKGNRAGTKPGNKSQTKDTRSTLIEHGPCQVPTCSFTIKAPPDARKVNLCDK